MMKKRKKVLLEEERKNNAVNGGWAVGKKIKKKCQIPSGGKKIRLEGGNVHDKKFIRARPGRK